MEDARRAYRRWLFGPLVIAALAAASVMPAGAVAQGPPPTGVPEFGQFRSVLAQGEGQSVTASDYVQYLSTGNPPDSFVNQQPLYVGIMPVAGSLTPGDLDTYYKDTNFGSMPGGTEGVETPRPGVHIYRDAAYDMPHIYGDNRYDVMFGAGYATAEDRLFFMDVLRRTAKGKLAGLLGPDAASDDADQLTDQDFSNAELDQQFRRLDQRFGAAGAKAQSDLLAYIDGINARIDYVKSHPDAMPIEYLGLNTLPERWTTSDTAAMAVMLVTQFTVSNGGEEVNSQLQQAFRKRFGTKWRKPYHDLREKNDPGAYVVAKRPFHSDRPGPKQEGLNAKPGFGSITDHNALVSTSSAANGASAPDTAGEAADPEAEQVAQQALDWLHEFQSPKQTLPDEESNAVMVTRQLSSNDHALAAMGPQVGYYSPQIFVEYELHGGGIDTSGVSFPGSSPYPLIGHGIDFAWSGTSANGDNEDTFVEKLCNPGGSKPTKHSTHYVYNGRCTPFDMRTQRVTTPPPDSETITYRTMRSVHGPVFAFARADGGPVALTKAKAVDFHELNSSISFMKLAENRAHSPQSFIHIMSSFPGTENWFYVDDENVAFMQSGRYPRHAKGSDVDLPFWGTGQADWQRFDPESYNFRAIPDSHRPRAVNPKDGFIISWNQKEAKGWVKGPREWSNGPVHRAKILQNRLFDQVRGGDGHVDLTGLTRAVNLAATTDLRGEELWPWMKRVIGNRGGEQARSLIALLQSWHRAGANRLDENGDNVYEHSGAVALMDAWWPKFVTAEFQPVLGEDLFAMVEDRVLGLGGDGWDWGSQVQKDLRNVLGKPEPDRYSRVYCGGPRKPPKTDREVLQATRGCAKVLLGTLRDAYAETAAAQGSDNPADWKVYATCDDPDTCDEIVPNTAGAVDTPPFPWQNRGTFHQIDELSGHR